MYRKLYISLWSRYKSPEFLGECPGGVPPSICSRGPAWCCRVLQ